MKRNLLVPPGLVALFLASVALVLLGPDVLEAQRPERLAYPPTPRVPHADRYHGQEVADPYRWLEDIGSSAVVEWARAQDALTRSVLDAAPERGMLRARIEQHTPTRDYSVPVPAGDRLFYLMLEAEAGRNVLVVRDGGEQRVVFAPEAPISHFAPSPAGDRVLVSLTPEDGGPSATVLVAVEDTERTSGPVPAAQGMVGADTLWDVRVSRSPWTADGQGFFYVAEENGEEAVHLHMMGRGEDEALPTELVGAEPGSVLTTRVTDGHGWLVVTARTTERDRITAVPLAADGRSGRPLRLLDVPDRYDFMDGADGTFWFRTTAGASRGRVVRVTAETPGRPEVVVAESRSILVDAFVFGGRIVTYSLRDARPEVRIFSPDGVHQETVELPLGLVFTDYLRLWPGFSGDPDRPEFFLRSLNLTAPGIYRLDARTGAIEPFLLRGIDVDPGQFVTRHVVYESADGERVPLFVAHRSDLALDGSAPALMFAYGAYGWTPVPFFNAKYLTFLESGGVFAIPYARGGGAKGAAWHQAGAGANKQNTIDDVIFAAEWLVRNCYTSPDRLALEGQGPAGAAVGGAATQRPNLFAAVIFDVAVTDMLRREAAGNAMVSELGTVADPAQFDALLAYSPYHAALRGTDRTAALIKTGDRDQVVPTMHAYKMAAALQAIPAAAGKPVLLRVDWSTGHGFGKTMEQRQEEWTDDLAFLWNVLPRAPDAQRGAGCPRDPAGPA